MVTLLHPIRNANDDLWCTMVDEATVQPQTTANAVLAQAARRLGANIEDADLSAVADAFARCFIFSFSTD